MREFELISQCFDHWGLQHANVVQGIGDDCLIWHNPKPLVISTDTAVIERHFPAHASPAQVANRSFLPALSDLAAMGATPAFFTLALTLPASLKGDWIVEFSQQLRALSQQYQCLLAGGDTTAGDQLTITISVHGTCEHPILRSGARIDDDIWVSGTLGRAAAALPAILSKNETDVPLMWLSAYWQPTPQVTLGQELLGHIHSAIDVSDGLLGDAGHIAQQSGVDFHIELNDIPMDSQLRALGEKGLKLALAGGDDYQLCFTAKPTERRVITDISQRLNTPVTRIGKVKAGEGRVHWYDNGQPKEFDWQSFEHFRENHHD